MPTNDEAEILAAAFQVNCDRLAALRGYSLRLWVQAGAITSLDFWATHPRVVAPGPTLPWHSAGP
jgi:hypothetical protein